MGNFFTKARRFGLDALRDAFLIDHDPGMAMMVSHTPAGQGKRHVARWAAGKREADAPHETRQLRRARERRTRKQVAE